MFDNQLYPLILTTINSQLEAVGIPGLIFAQAYQPWRQGVDKQAAGYLYKISDHRFGFPYNDYVYDVATGTEVYAQLQVYQSTFQMSTLAIQDPSNQTQLTASDIANLLSAVLQNDITIATFIKQGVGVLNIFEVRNPYFLNDSNEYQAAPNFDFTLTHPQVLSTTVPFAEVVDLNIINVK